MNLIISKTDRLAKVIIVDMIVLAMICLVPALSHAFAFPLYKFNPMLLCLLAGMVFVNDRRNAYMLAFLLPVVSMLVSGMPTPLKALCMVAEFEAFVAIFYIIEKRMPVFLAVVLAAVAGKIIFYLLEALIIAPAVLIGTNIWLQLCVILVYAIAFSLLVVRRY
ncbi:MAG: hypothetical protein J6X58_06160 [Bacteroidales bacterium]|nr:hypothetical protein [Bacteroidales bacterium]